MSYSLTFAQNPSYIQYTTEDGLPSNNVYCVFEDSKGYIWFGTDRGVARFNGKSFKIYGVEDGLFSSFAPYIKEAPDGKIWFLGPAGVSYYLDGKITTPEFNKGLKRSSAEFNVTTKYDISIYQDSLFSIVTDVGLYIPKYDTVVSKPNDSNLNMVYRQKDGEYFYHKGHQYTLQAGKVKSYLLMGYQQFPNDQYLIRYSDKLYLLRSGTIHFLRSFNSSINSIVPFSDSLAYICAHNHDIVLYNFLTNEIKSTVFRSNYNTGITKDHEGSYWISTEHNGAYCVPNISVQSYLNKSKSSITHLKGYKDRFWFVTASGDVYTYNDSLIKIAHYANRIMSIVLDRHNEPHIGVQELGVINLITLKKAHMRTGRITFFSRSNGIFFASRYLLTYANPLSPDISNQTRMTQKGWTHQIRAMHDGPGNSLLAATDDGVLVYDIADSSWSLFKPKIPEFKFRFVDIHKSDNRYTFSSSSRGVVLFENDTIQHITKTDGLSSNVCYHSFIDTSGDLWVSTNNGLNRIHHPFDPANRKIVLYNKTHGLSSNMVNASYVYGDSVWVATAGGLNVFNKNHLVPNPKPLLYISSVSINNKIKPIEKVYDLAYDENTLRFELEGISYKKRDGVHFEYRLIGNDNNWIYTEDDYALFSALESGNYVLEIRAVGPNGIEKSRIKRIFINIDKPFWEQWYFYLISGLIIIGVSYIIVRRRIIQVKQRQDLLEELNTVKQQSLSAQMNPHFLFNSLNSIQRYILENDRKASNKYLSKFSRLMRLVLENSKKPLIPVNDELEALELYLELESMRFKDKLSYSIELDDLMDATAFQIPPLLLQPFVENAVWHGIMHKDSPGCITIHIYESETNFVSSIEDDGIGRKRSMEIKKENLKYKSSGLDISNKRLELIKKLFGEDITISITDVNHENENTGTRVTIKVPKPTNQNV